MMEIFFKQNLKFLFENTDITKSSVEKKLTQEKKSTQLISKGLLSKYCTGSIDMPSVKKAGEIAELLGLTLDELIYESLDNIYVFFCKKLLNMTKNNVISWDTIDLWETDCETDLENCEATHSNRYWLFCDDGVCKFRSKSMNDYHTSGELTVFLTTNNDGEFIIIKFPEIYNGKNRYELYTMNNDGPQVVCASHFKDETSNEIICKDKYYNILEELYHIASRQQAVNIIDKYLGL